ncbi:488_t:CDS:10 [Ambispora gerdemannii]|uniref:Anaphase-promoting complex subunit 4 n=1 Tax=Ambispora gerdemannii TaxID=144530 RepID=A0A9N9F5Q8_9GLOM|nr:488_t:CDS:10 [Ambispora gerdemannii]
MEFSESSRIPYRLLNQHGVKEQIKLYTICPTMDLIAACSVSGEVWVARWFVALEKIWTLPTQRYNAEKVEALAWRPDGKVLAIGYSSGVVRLFNVDTNEMIHELSQRSAPSPSSPLSQSTSNNADSVAGINFLTWLDDKENNDQEALPISQYQDPNYLSTYPGEKYMPRLSTIPGSKISKILGYPSEIDDGEDTEDEMNKSIDLLVAGDTDGNLHLSVYGIYNLESISLTEFTKSRNAKILSASVSSDLSLLALLILSEDEESDSSSTMAEKKQKRYIELTFGTGLLHTHKPEIRILSQRYTIIKFLINYIVEGIKKMESQYDHMKESAKAYTEPFQEVLENHEVNTTLRAEFVRLLATGRPSVTMSEYIESRLTKRGLKDWENKGLKSLEQIREFVHDYVRPCCERLLLQITALVGYSKWPQKFEQLGLKEQFVHSCVILIGYLIGRLEELLSVIDNEYQNFMEFQEWLQTGIDIKNVSAYLRNSLDKGVLDEFFVEPSYSVIQSENDFPSEASISPTPIPRTTKVPDPFDYSGSPSFPTYPYDFTRIKSENEKNNNHSNIIRWYIDTLSEKCSTLYASTANNVARSVVANKSIVIIEFDNDEVTKEWDAQGNPLSAKFLIDSRIVVKKSNTYHYVAFFLPRSFFKTENHTLWIVRFSFDSIHHQHQANQDSRIQNICEVSCLQLKTENNSDDDNLALLDLQFLKDERLLMLTNTINEDAGEIYSLSELNYIELNYTKLENLHNIVEIVEQALIKLDINECPKVQFQKSRIITQFRPSKIATNREIFVLKFSQSNSKLSVATINDFKEDLYAILCSYKDKCNIHMYTKNRATKILSNFNFSFSTAEVKQFIKNLEYREETRINVTSTYTATVLKDQQQNQKLIDQLRETSNSEKGKEHDEEPFVEWEFDTPKPSWLDKIAHERDSLIYNAFNCNNKKTKYELSLKIIDLSDPEIATPISEDELSELNAKFSSLLENWTILEPEAEKCLQSLEKN